MSNRTASTLIAIIILLSFVMGALVYPRLPEQVASHWNAQGQVDGYTTRFWGIALLPLTLLAVTLLLWFIPALDPLKANINLFRPAYNLFIVAFGVYFLYLHAATLLVNLGVSLNMSLTLIPAFAGLSWLLGVLLGQAQRNFFIGIRTPWTLSSDTVWAQTHRRAARLYKIAAPLTLLGFLFPRQAMAFILVPLLAVSFYAVVYSYLLYRRESGPTA